MSLSDFTERETLLSYDMRLMNPTHNYNAVPPCRNCGDYSNGSTYCDSCEREFDETMRYFNRSQNPADCEACDGVGTVEAAHMDVAYDIPCPYCRREDAA